MCYLCTCVNIWHTVLFNANHSKVFTERLGASMCLSAWMSYSPSSDEWKLCQVLLQKWDDSTKSWNSRTRRRWSQPSDHIVFYCSFSFPNISSTQATSLPILYPTYLEYLVERTAVGFFCTFSQLLTTTSHAFFTNTRVSWLATIQNSTWRGLK